MRLRMMPGWTRKLMGERKFRKAVIRAAKFETMQIMARWDRGNAWCGWRNGPGTEYAWKHIPLHGMHSQMDVPVSVSGRTLIHSPRPNEWYDTSFETENAARISFWNWED
jgi:hypothetical protein